MAISSDVRVRAFPAMPADALELLASGELAKAVPDWDRRLTTAWEDSALPGAARLRWAWDEVLLAYDRATASGAELGL